MTAFLWVISLILSNGVTCWLTGAIWYAKGREDGTDWMYRYMSKKRAME